MTTTLIKTNNPSSRIYNLTGLESLSFKMVSILFIVILSVTHLSSQTSDQKGKVHAFAYADLNSGLESKPMVISVQPRIYTVYIAKNFPTLHSNLSTKLQAMSDSESFDYTEFFTDSLLKKNGAVPKIVSLAVTKSIKKYTKNKVAPKLNS